jgi:beta-D-xylosidase 4
VNFIQGFEHAKETTYPLQASACCKHFVANELDHTNGTVSFARTPAPDRARKTRYEFSFISPYTPPGPTKQDRYHFDAYVPQQDLVDSYLPSFQMCVEEGKVSGIMCSYNAVNGVPSCANDWLLGTLLRESWQFDGCAFARAPPHPNAHPKKTPHP